MRADGFRPFSSILCPVDFSVHSSRALRYAASLARRSDARLTVLFVNDPLLVAAAAAAYNEQTLGTVSQEELTRFVAESLTPAARRGLHLEYSSALGRPARTILNAADSGGHDAIVLGTKGLNGARRIFFGSTTAEILRRTRVPVLAVPLPGSREREGSIPRGWPGRRVLTPVALDAYAERDLRRAAEFASWLKAALTVVHVVPAPTTPGWFQGDMNGQVRNLSEKAHLALEALTAAMHIECSTVVATGYPPDEIAREAAERQVGLVVMALRGSEGLLGAPVGSIAYAVLSHDIAPVLALPARGRKRASRRHAAPATAKSGRR
ncbi:MAG: universal stress protein [Vicinamibacterales bacterium]